MGTTFLAFLGAAGAAWMWLWKRAIWPTFAGGVLDAVTPLQDAIDRLSESITQTTGSVELALAERAVQVDTKFDAITSAQTSLLNRLAMLEVRQVKETEKVVAAVQASTTPIAVEQLQVSIDAATVGRETQVTVESMETKMDEQIERANGLVGDAP